MVKMKLNIHFTCFIPDRFIGTNINKLLDSHSFWMRTVPSPFFQTGGGGSAVQWKGVRSQRGEGVRWHALLIMSGSLKGYFSPAGFTVI